MVGVQWIEGRHSVVMGKRSGTLETTLLAIELLRRIPRNRKVTAEELHAQVKEAGFDRDLRTIQRQLIDGSFTFREAAATFSEDDRTKSLAGDLGWFSTDRMPADFIAAVQKLQPGQTSPPVLTRLGWHLIHLIERRQSRLPSLEEARAEIHTALESKALNQTRE